MKAFLITAGVLLAVASCTRIFGSTEKKTCEHIAAVCASASAFNAKDVDGCTADLPKLKDRIDDAEYAKFLACSGDATNCAEVAGCTAGLSANVMEKVGNDMERGFDKMRK